MFGITLPAYFQQIEIRELSACDLNCEAQA